MLLMFRRYSERRHLNECLEGTVKGDINVVNV